MASGKGVNVGLMTEKKAFWNPIIVVSAAVVNIALNFALIPTYGMMGAAVATLIAYAFMVWFRWYMSTKYHPVAYEWGRIVLLLGVAAVMYTGIVLIPIANPYVSFGVRFALAATYPLVLLPLGFYTTREKTRIRELVRRQQR